MVVKYIDIQLIRIVKYVVKHLINYFNQIFN